MWQQDPFQVDGRLLKECQSLEAPIGVDSAASPNNFISLVSISSIAPDSGWQRAASLVQSPASINSEGSATSTPDQCPASPAATFCDMPSCRNTSCNKTMIPSTSKEKQQEISQWKSFPSQCPNLDSGRWSQELPGASSQMASKLAAPNSFFTSKSGQHGSQAQAGGWSSILNDPEVCAGGGYLLEGLNEALISKATSKIEAGVMAGCSITESQRPLHLGSSSFGSLYQVEMQGHQRIKQEEEQFAGGLVIDNKVFSLQKSDMENSKIANFMDLLRHSDRPIPISEATAAASCNQLTQLLTGQEAPGMWIARSSRLPAMLSEVLPSGSGGELFESRNKRALLECSTSEGDTLDRQQHQEASPSLKQQQDEDEPLRDRGVASFGIQATNDDITCELFSKRPRIENSTCFPFKMQVRKEKLGERISALQQLVSPFGKTDTASVLLEAIGYIKFLHEQVQVLSSPYMKHTSTATRHIEHGKFCWSSSDKEEDAKQDLRSRGLCLVPISCTLQVANDNGADYWTPTLHGGLK